MSKSAQTSTQSELEQIHGHLREIRKRKDLELKPCTYLARELVSRSGEMVPFVLRYYQVQGVLHLLTMKRFILGDDTGTGKTAQSIAALCFIWEKTPEQKVVVLTTKSAVTQWCEEFKKFTNGVHTIQVRDAKKHRQKAYQEFGETSGPTVLVMNYAKARTDFQILQGWKNYILVADECTAFKSTKSQIHKVCKHLASQASRVWGLSATIIKNNLEEGYGIYKVIVPWVFGTKQSFYDEYCVIELLRVPGISRRIPHIKGHTKQHIERFRSKIDLYFLGRPKHEVATELPALTSRQVEVGMTTAQQELYLEALGGILRVGEGDTATEREVTHLTAITYCQQVVNHPSLLEREGESEKLRVLLEILSEGDLADEKVIIFSRLRKMVDIIVPALNQKHTSKHRKSPYCVRITGAEKASDREASQALFQDPGSETKIVCITMAGSDAINLQAAKAVIFYDTPWSAGDYLQILGRMIRIGSVHDSVYAIHLVVKDSVDARTMDVLTSKMHLVENVLGKRIKGGDGDDSDFFVSSNNSILELFASLQEDARKKAW